MQRVYLYVPERGELLGKETGERRDLCQAEPPPDLTDTMSNHHARVGGVWPGLGFLVPGRGMLFSGLGPGVNHVALFTLDTLYTAVQSAGEVKASEMVHDAT